MTETSGSDDKEAPAATEQPADTDRPTTPKSRSQGPTAHDWERYRSLIIDLYVERDMTLSDVRKFMEQHYNFTASDRMYKTRFLNWHIQKNVKSRDMEALIRIAREQRHKRPDFLVEGKVVPFSKIQRYVRRSGRTMQEVGLDHPWTPLVVRPPANTVSEDSLPSLHGHTDFGTLPFRSPSSMSGVNTRITSPVPNTTPMPDTSPEALTDTSPEALTETSPEALTDTSPEALTDTYPEALTDTTNADTPETNVHQPNADFQQIQTLESNATLTPTGPAESPKRYPSTPSIPYQAPGRRRMQVDILRQGLLLALLISASMRFKYARLEDLIDANLESPKGESFDSNDLTRAVDLLGFLQLSQEVVFPAVTYLFIFNASASSDKKMNVWMQLVIALKFSQAILDDFPYSPVVWTAALHGVGVSVAGLAWFEAEILCDVSIDLFPRPSGKQSIESLDKLASALLVSFDQGKLKPTTARWNFQYELENFAILRRQNDKLVEALAESETRQTKLERSHADEIGRLDLENAMLKEQIEALRTHVQRLSLRDENIIPATGKLQCNDQPVEGPAQETPVVPEQGL